MYKPISNYNGHKSQICSEVESGKDIVVDQTYCCKNEECFSYSHDNCISNSTGYEGYEVAQCHNITTLEACNRNDSTVAQVYGGLQNGLFCLSGVAGINDPYYSRFSEGLEWMINRSTEVDSYNVTVCDNGNSYQICNASSVPNGTVAYLTCGDLFQSEYTCNWVNVTKGVNAELVRNPIGELCGIMPATRDDFAVIIIALGMIVAYLFIYKWKNGGLPPSPVDQGVKMEMVVMV